MSSNLLNMSLQTSSCLRFAPDTYWLLILLSKNASKLLNEVLNFSIKVVTLLCPLIAVLMSSTFNEAFTSEIF
jgi:phosphoglycerol transferase MdoB-like AlkP superfamily enzyme